MALPNGYTKLEYIESTGTQYISTGITPTENTKVVIEFSSSSSSGVVFGQDSGYKVNAFMVAMTVVVFDSTKKDISISANAKHTVQVAPKAFKVDNGSSQYIYANKVNAAYPMFLFGNNRKGKFSEGVAMKLYSFKVYENDVLIADYIPCKQGNAVGLYDDVAGAMNLPLWAGDFTAGPSISGTHRTLVNGTTYTVQGGKCRVNGTVYNILKGRTLIGGTGYDITFPEPLVMPVKGDLITMNLDGTDRLYRVLKIVSGTTVEVLGIWDGLSSYFISNLNGSDIYAGSPLDLCLNTTWYNTLSSNAKAAIVPKNISQYQYGFNSSVYNQITHASYADYNSKSLKSAILYERNIYALDIEDIEEYFGGTAGSVSSNTSGKFSGDDLVTLFWNTTAPGFIYMWLRSAAQNSSPSVWQIAGFYKQIAQVTGSSSKPSYVARPAFQIDLSKIDFMIN